MGSIAFTSDKINTQAYQSVIKSHILPNAEFLAGKSWENKYDHTSDSTKKLVPSQQCWNFEMAS